MPDVLSRREFLSLCAGAAGAGLVSGCATIPVYRTAIQSGRLSLTRVEFDALAGEKLAIALSAPELDKHVLLLQEPDGTLRAFSSECTHQACTVRPRGSFLVCPCHGSTFDLDGNVVRGPARKPLPTFPVTVENGRIEVQLIEARTRS